MSFPDLKFEMALRLTPDFDQRIWEDFSGYLTAFTPDRGRVDERQPVDAGTCEFRLRNDERIFDPTWGAPDGPNEHDFNSNVDASAETSLAGWTDPADYDLARLTYPGGTSIVPLEGLSYVKATWDGGATTQITTIDTVLSTASVTRRFLLSCFVYVPASGVWNGGSIRIQQTGFTGATFVARQDADLSKRDQWQRIWAIYDIPSTDWVGFSEIVALSNPTLGSAWVGLDFAEAGELHHGQTTMSTGPLYPNLTPERPVRLRAGWLNQLPNPSFETDTSTWSATGGGTLTRVGSLSEPASKVGTAIANLSPTSAADSGMLLNTGSCPAASPGEIWSASCWLRGSNSRTVTLRLRALNSSNTVLATYTSNVVTVDGTIWKRAFVTSPPLPASTAKVQVVVATASSGSAGNLFADGLTLSEYPYATPTLEAADGYAEQYVGRIESVVLDWPASGHDAYATVSAVDLLTTLETRSLPTTAPTFETYTELVEYDRPFWYAKLDETENPLGLAAAVVGNDGRYILSPTLGVAGAIAGDYSSAVQFDASPDLQRVFATCGLDDFRGANRVTCELWAKRVAGTPGVPYPLMNGPEYVAGSVPIFELIISGTPEKFAFRCRFNDGTSSAASGTTTVVQDTWYHVVGTWDGTDVKVYVNGILEATATPAAGKVLRIPTDTSPGIRLAAFPGSSTGSNAALDEPAAYERDIGVDRILAHYQGGLRGFPEQTLDDRLDAILDLFGTLVPAADRVYVDAAADETCARRQYGQSALTALRDVEVAADGVLFVSRAGKLVLLGNDYRDVAPWSTTRLLLSNEPVDGVSYPYRDAELAPFDDSYVINVCRRTAEHLGHQMESRIGASVRRFGERVDDGEEIVPVPTNARALELAQQCTRRAAFPAQRLTSVKLAGGFDVDGEIWRAILERDLEDLVDVEKHDVDSALGSTRQLCRVKGVAHTVTRLSWETTWTVAPADV